MKRMCQKHTAIAVSGSQVAERVGGVRMHLQRSGSFVWNVSHVRGVITTKLDANV